MFSSTVSMSVDAALFSAACFLAVDPETKETKATLSLNVQIHIQSGNVEAPLGCQAIDSSNTASPLPMQLSESGARAASQGCTEATNAEEVKSSDARGSVPRDSNIPLII